MLGYRPDFTKQPYNSAKMSTCHQIMLKNPVKNVIIPRICIDGIIIDILIGNLK